MRKPQKRVSPKLTALAVAMAVSGATFSADYYGTTEAFASEAIYFIVTDRFVNGDTSNDQRTQGQSAGLGTWDRQLCANGTNIGYLGGDFQGIYNNADYISEMGFTSVWITPIVDNPNESFTGGNPLSCGTGVGADNGKTGYHGYWAHNFYHVDEHWESPALTFRDFNTKMETEFGIKTVLDIVANHGSPAYSMTFEQNNFGEIYDENWNKLADHQNLNPNQLDSNNPLHQWYNKGGGLAQLSDLAESNPEVMDYLVGAYLKWIEQGADAFRIDTIAWMPHSFWKEFSDRIRAQHPDFYMFGENFNFNAGTIAEHQKPENGGISVLDFPGRQAMTNVFQDASSDYANILWYLDLNKEIYTNPYDLATFYDNHDMSRMSASGNSNAFIDANNWLFTSRGIPVVYYGSEMMFMNGASEHAGNRNYYGENNIANARASETFSKLSAIGQIRKASIALQRGVQVNGTFEGQTAQFFRVYEKDGVTQTALVLLNKGDGSAAFNVDALVSAGDWVDAQTGEVITSSGSINTSVSGHDVKVLLLNAPTTNLDMLDILNDGGEKVTVTPTDLIAGDNALVRYRGAADQNYELHWGINNWAGSGAPAGDEPMVYNSETRRYEATVTLPAEAFQFDFVVHNLTDDTWDNNGGADWQYPVQFDDDIPPTTPTSVSALAGNGQVVLSWAASVRADSYEVFFTDDGSVPNENDQKMSTNATSILHSGLTNGVTYQYAVLASNSFGNSDLSEVASATPNDSFDSNFGSNPTLNLTGTEFGNWDPANATYAMQLVADNTWQTQVVVAADLINTPYKLTLNGGWAVNWGGNANGQQASLNVGGGNATVTLSAGTYQVTVQEGVNTASAVQITWELAGDPVLAVSPAVLDLGDVVAGALASGNVTATNAGGGSLIVESATESATWMTVSVNNLSVNVDVDATGLVVGQLYSDQVLVSSNGGDEFVEVRFTVVDEPIGVDVSFTCFNGTTIEGQSVYVVGNITDLGNWNVANALKLDPTGYPTWTKTFQMPASSALQWKCIKRDEVNPNEDLVWQGGSNNTVTTPSAGTASTNGSF